VEIARRAKDAGSRYARYGRQTLSAFSKADTRRSLKKLKQNVHRTAQKLETGG
jgi:hypothetical protein